MCTVNGPHIAWKCLAYRLASSAPAGLLGDKTGNCVCSPCFALALISLRNPADAARAGLWSGRGGGRDEVHSCVKLWKKEDCVSVRRGSIDLCIDFDHGGRVPSVMKSSSLGVGQPWVQIPGVSD